MGCNLCFSIISIHAPTRGATYQQVHFTVAYIIFQSTLPREERHREGTGHSKGWHFNPRSHERSDWMLISMLNLTLFQSTLPREERRVTILICGGVYNISIHAPTRGATAILHKKFVYFYTIPTINI